MDMEQGHDVKTAVVAGQLKCAYNVVRGSQKIPVGKGNYLGPRCRAGRVEIEGDVVGLRSAINLRMEAEQRRWPEALARLAPWTGAFFALGHGLIVVAMAVAVTLMSDRIRWPETLLTHVSCRSP